MSKRGLLIVVEGCDRAGKSTQCKRLVESLRQLGRNVKYMNFPERNTKLGHLIDAYLTKKSQFSNEEIHLLFTLNRWEFKDKMENLLKDGTTLIVDRYSYSGVAYSAAKGLSIEWCKAPETGLLKPDQVYFLTLSTEAQSRRNGFGEEIYDKLDFQNRVSKIFNQLYDANYWTCIDADKTVDELHSELLTKTLAKIDEGGTNELSTLW